MVSEHLQGLPNRKHRPGSIDGISDSCPIQQEYKVVRIRQFQERIDQRSISAGILIGFSRAIGDKKTFS